jgi:hypothetical protein
MLHILIDTSVWLDLAKDYRQQALLVCLDTLVEDGQAALILPQVVVEEFARNKDRVVRESSQSLSSLFRHVRDTVGQFGDDATKDDLIAQLSEIDHRVSRHGEAAIGGVQRIEALFAKSAAIPASDAVKLRAMDRAVLGRAPFHRHRNAVADAILIEQYRDETVVVVGPDRCAFVTHNVKDFSEPAGDSRRPHPDLAPYFDTEASVYATSLAAILGEFAPELLEEVRFEAEWSSQSRKLSEILEAMDEFHDKVWYGRHWGWRNQVESGKMRVVDRKDLPPDGSRTGFIAQDIYEGAVSAAKEMEARFGDDLGPWTDFEWGMLSGKLSALRWVLGDEWDMLDT